MKHLPKEKPTHEQRLAFFHLMAEHLVTALITTVEEMRIQQNSLFLELGRTAPDLFQLSVQVAQSLYQTGLFAFGVKRLHDALSEGELQALVYALLCRDSKERLITLAERWIVRSHSRPSEEPTHVRLFHNAPTERLSSPEQQHAAAEGPMSEMPAVRGRFGRGTTVQQSGRRTPARRTSWSL